jgi:hypothetical protein
MPASQPLPRTLQPPPELPNDPKLSDTLAQYLRNFSLWCRHGFADKVSSSSSQPGVLLQATVNVPSDVNPNSFLLQVGQSGGVWISPVAMGKGQPSHGAVGTPVQINSTGVADGSAAAAGQIGEILSVTTPAAVTLPNGVAASVASLTLTPGDWDLHGELWMIAASGGVTTAVAAINTNVVLPGGSQPITARSQSSGAITASGGWFTPLQTVRVSISVATTYYLIGYSAYPSGASTATGCLWARRMR